MGPPLEDPADDNDNDEESQGVLRHRHHVMRRTSSKDHGDGLLEMITSMEVASIQQNPTFEESLESSTVAAVDELDIFGCSTTTKQFSPTAIVETEEVLVEADEKEDKETTISQLFLYIIHIATFGILGTVLRIYMGRFFGMDCEHHSHSAQDFLTPLSSRICVTNSGKTEQTGGALFTDLPANMLGSFVAGLTIPAKAGQHPFVWFQPDHPLQQNAAFDTALHVGFCSCLTTFASWNTQMVVMLDGTDTVLGPQVASALFGYMIGVACSIASFLFGRHVYDWWRPTRPNPRPIQHHPVAQQQQQQQQPERHDAGIVVISEGTTTREEVPEEEQQQQQERSDKKKSTWERISCLIGINVSPFVLVAGLLAAFAVADAVEGILFYRKMWLSCVFTPFGAILRWRLSRYNERKGWWKRLEWVPWGTLTANFVAAVVSIVAEALEARYVEPSEAGNDWLATILPAIEAGFAGSLSTVATMVKEMVDMKKPAHGYLYGFGTIVCSMLMSIILYSPIVRSG